ncbi:MAG: PEGA domain-containing protein, partial [Deltaproteobacteria bacterium]|nr:PEGA domain-containing protein [Deltaproteobacteria bacterium]
KKHSETIKPKKGKPLLVKLELEKKKKGGGGGGGGGTAVGGKGKLVLDSQPWANVAIPGVGKFVTPFQTALPAGKYKVTLTNPGGLKKVIKVTIGPGETVRKKVKLQ